MENFYLSPIDGSYIIVLSVLVGLEVIKNVPVVLHTPLMSGANAISGIVVIGGTIQLLTTPMDNMPLLLSAAVAVFIGTLNVAGGFFVTHRMLSMFSTKKSNKNA
jgi:NAD(P) transhydrogenase subunit alpha